MKRFICFMTMVALGCLFSGCGKSGNLSNEEILKMRAEQKNMKQVRRIQRPYVAELEEVKSPGAIKKAIESLPWVEGSARVDMKSATFHVKEGQQLNDQELKKAIETTGDAKVKSVGRMKVEQ